MSVLPPRPLKLRIGFVLSSFAIGLFAFVVAAFLTYQGFAAAFRLEILAAPIALWGGISLFRRGWSARVVARDSDEIVAELIDVARTRRRGAEERRYRFRVDGKEHRMLAIHSTQRPLFLDEEHTRAVALRARSGQIVILSVDLSPFSFSADAERAVRERIEQLRQVRKLVSDIHTC